MLAVHRNISNRAQGSSRQTPLRSSGAHAPMDSQEDLLKSFIRVDDLADRYVMGSLLGEGRFSKVWSAKPASGDAPVSVPVALKEIALDVLEEDEEAFEMLEAEIDALRHSSTHESLGECVVKLHEVIKTDECVPAAVAGPSALHTVSPAAPPQPTRRFSPRLCTARHSTCGTAASFESGGPAWCGGRFIVLVLDRVPGEELFNVIDAKGSLPLVTVHVIMQQLLSALAALHELGIVHRRAGTHPSPIASGAAARRPHSPSGHARTLAGTSSPRT